MENSNEALIENITNAAGQDDASNETLSKYLSFMLDNEVYAFNIMSIKEIIEYENVNSIPLVPDYIRGVTNLRGSVVPVIDLSVRLGKPTEPVSKRTCIIIVEVNCDDEKTDVGVVIDSIYEVTGFAEQDIEPAPGFGAGVRADFIEGMGRKGESFVLLLNAERVLSIEELSVLIAESGQTSKRRPVQVEAEQHDRSPDASAD